MTPLLKVAWLPVSEKKVLFARSRGQELFFNIGGKLEPLESDHKALVREVREETTVSLRSNTISRVHTFVGPAGGKAEGKILVLLAFSADYDGTLQPAGEVEELAWFGVSDRHRTTPVGRQIIDWLYSHGLIE